MSEQDKRPEDRGRPSPEGPEDPNVPEPDLHVSADDVELAEPTLHEARISDETAAEADVAVAAAEAQAVEEEAEAAGRLVGGNREDDIKVSGTAPAGAAAGDQDRLDSAESIQDAAIPDAHSPEPWPTSAAAPASPAAPSSPAVSPTSPVLPPSDWESAPASTDGSAPEKKWYATPDGGTALNTDNDGGLPPGSADDGAAEDPAAGSGRNIDWKPLVIIGAVVIVAIVIIALIVSSLTNSSPAGGAASPSTSQSKAETANADGVIAEDVSPFDFQQGQCFTDFEAVMRDATVVTCDTPHTAQLVGTYSYGADEEFPGADELNLKAQEVCTAVVLNDSAADQPELKDSYGMPSKETWAQGDRRIDCFKIAAEGEEITGTLVGQ
ncbi:septum formation family protein [Arthrobacter sulfonylureivorans]|uniref:septum formation family protein n=1 Tax=Arthrobacter sulfonylureivorans TaxID=2486855 RepID=UPI0039E64CCB